MAAALSLAALVTTVAAAAAAAGSHAQDQEAERLQTIERLKNTIHTLPAGEAAARFASLERRTSPPHRQDKVDHFGGSKQPARIFSFCCWVACCVVFLHICICAFCPWQPAY